MYAYLDIKSFVNAQPELGAGEFLYCLVDSAAVPSLHKKLATVTSPWVSLFEGSREENALSVAPILIVVAGESGMVAPNSLLSWLAEKGTFTSCLSFIRSRHAMREQARALTARLDARLEDRTDVLLRYYDPRVFEALLDILSERPLGALLAAAQEWWFVDRTGQVQRVRQVVPASGDAQENVELTEAQEFALVAASEPDQIAEILSENFPDELRSLARPLRHAFITGQIVTARQFNVASTYELALFCGLALVSGVDYHTEDPWLTVLQAVGRGELKFSDAVLSVEVHAKTV